jgi:hypothetical protein
MVRPFDVQSKGLSWLRTYELSGDFPFTSSRTLIMRRFGMRQASEGLDEPVRLPTTAI